LSLIYLPGHGLIGIATSRSVGGKPQRNRLKRRIREALRRCGEVPAGLDMVAQVGAQWRKTPFQELSQELSRLMEQVRARWESESVSS
jgi:ribonuclease P protein component